MEPVIIASPDAMPLPAPVWLLKSLLLLTFFLHIVPMNIVLGGSFTAFVSDFMGRKGGREHQRTLARSFARTIPVAMAFTITLGIAPLLFLQVLYGQLFYSASILMGWPWLSIIVLVIAAYYSFYVYSYGDASPSRARLWVLLLGSIVVGAIAMLYRNAMTLMLHPETFNGIYQAEPAGTVLSVPDPSSLPRFLHFFIGSIAVAGLYTVILGLRSLKTDAPYGRWALRTGSILFASATLVEMGVGIWFLLALPHDVMMLFMGDSVLATALLGFGVLFPFGSMALLMTALRSGQPKTRVILGISLAALTVVVMVVMRDIVRDGYLSSVFDVTARVEAPMWGVIGLFVGLLVAGLGVTSYMLKLVVNASRNPSHT